METAGRETVSFRTYDNAFHTITLDQLKSIQTDVFTHIQALYERKWALEKAILDAPSHHALDAIDIRMA